MTRFESEGERPSVMGFAPLNGGSRKYAVWGFGEREGREPGDVGSYGLLERQNNGDFLLFLPDCSRTREIALSAGAVIESGVGVRTCHFPDRASLEAGLRQLNPDSAGPVVRLVRIGDG